MGNDMEKKLEDYMEAELIVGASRDCEVRPSSIGIRFWGTVSKDYG